MEGVLYPKIVKKMSETDKKQNHIKINKNL